MRRDPGSWFDVAIAGAGLAGSSLALRLSRRGAHVALLDPGVFPREKLCGEYLSPEGGEALERLGLAEDLARTGLQPIRRVRLSTPRGRELVAEVTGPDGRAGFGLSRSTLDALLVQHARRAGVSVFEGCRVGGPLLDQGRVVGVRARAASEPFEIRARVVVAADGRHSSLVRQTGLTRPRSGFRPRLAGLKRHWRLDDDNDSAAEPIGTVGLHLVPGGYGGTCRVEGPWINFCALLPEAILRRHKGDLDRAAIAYFGRNPVLRRFLDAAEPDGSWKTVAGVRVEVSRPRQPGIFYVGDAQGTVDPLGGQGMTMALLGAERLAPIVERALAAGGADLALQRLWLQTWRHHFDRRIRLCRLFHHLLVNPWLVDLASVFPRLARPLVAAGYQQTRDPGWNVTTP